MGRLKVSQIFVVGKNGHRKFGRLEVFQIFVVRENCLRKFVQSKRLHHFSKGSFTTNNLRSLIE